MRRLSGNVTRGCQFLSVCCSSPAQLEVVLKPHMINRQLSKRLRTQANIISKV